MLIMGVNVPLIELILTFIIIIFILLIEAAIVIFMLVRQLRRTKKLSDLIANLSDAILEIKEKEIEEISRLKK